MTKLLSALDDLREANRAVKEACPNNWREQMHVYRLMITEQRRFQANILFAAIILASGYPQNDNTVMWIYATALEMIEEG